jgi:DNA-binding response OmpR family regulator
MNPGFGSTQRVLVAEDDEEISRLLVQLIHRSKIEAVAVFDGLEILPHLNSMTFDLLLLDLQMPGQHGLIVLKELRLTSDIPVIILTALSEEKDRIAGLELGADDYVVKPFYPTEVLLRIQNLIKRRGQTRNRFHRSYRLGH